MDDRITLIRKKMRAWADNYPRYIMFGPAHYHPRRDVNEIDAFMWGPYPEVGVKLYKTSRNALAGAGKYGVLLHADFERLLIVDASEGLVTKGASNNEVGDSEFCERQAVLWIQRAERLRAVGK